jgi:GAF domain-containing protein/DNA-binding transcriptional ArsR family regulator
LLIRAGTRDEVEQGICRRLTEMAPYDFAWVGTVPPESSHVEPRTWEGAENGYLDAVSLGLGGPEPVAETAETGVPTVVSNVTDHLRDREWAEAAVDRNFQSVAAVPLVYGETTYGILGVYASDIDAFEEPVASVLAELGELTAYSINSVETRRGILSERMTELELQIETPGGFLNAVAAVAGQLVSYREILPEEGGTARVLFALDDPPVDDVLALEDEFVAVDGFSHVDAGDEHVFRATVGGKTVAATLLKCGGLPHEVTASPDETHVIVRIPQELDVRVYLDRVRESYPETSLVSRRTVDSRPERPDIDATLAANLTDRQREVLLTAYRCGFFESPRETTGSELAALLDISQPTLTHHLREAQRRLFEAIYESDD